MLNVNELNQNKAKIKAKNFDNWTNDPENEQKALANEDVSVFTMFNYNKDTYNQDLQNFAQEYINLYDKDGNKSWDKNEFITMATGGIDASQLDSETLKLFDQLYDTLNLDNKKDEINAGEFASLLYTVDTVDGTGESTDGKLDYTMYQTLSGLAPGDSLYDAVLDVRKTYFDITNPKEQKPMKADDRIKTDDKGQKYITVEKYRAQDKNGNNCLSRIINNCYDLKKMGIKLYSKEYHELEKQIMDANPEIYGTENSPKRNSAIIHPGDKLILP